MTADDLLAGKLTVADAAAFVARHRGKDPIVYSSADPQAVKQAQAQARHGGKRVAEAIETFFGAAVRHETVSAGHNLSQADVALARAWFDER